MQKIETSQQPISSFTPLNANPDKGCSTPITGHSILDEEDGEKRTGLFAIRFFFSDGLLTSMPAPRNPATLGVASICSGSESRCAIATDGSTSNSGGFEGEKESGVDQSREGYENYDVGFDQNGEDYVKS
ncbi:hypothetical protein OIU77_005574 [Salix suchowensis]|uniref:Uncharacterized protein n=1 Tax=Salix suchowensis TaxID=1278906 RepID=A0ABQ9AR15_9ROSI|nr:hypothetical protein OIU77_005574 [Salix suchowensis]